MPASPSSGTSAPFPEKIGKYELLLPIGTGGMATVYLARTSGAGGFTRDVALKLVHAHLRGDEESKLQLLEEAKLAARIRHPNVVPVHEVDEDPYGLFLVMDYVEGDNLSGVVRTARSHGEPVTNRLIARVINDALLGLHAAHELNDVDGFALNLVHRDFSPQNILVSIQGITRLGDFGVAKAADRAIRTKTGLVKGKISYMSPEQARGHALDRRCDVWAAGVVAWELLARRRMHAAEDDVTTLLRIVTEVPPRVRSVRPDLPEAVDDAVAWALAPRLEDRCPTAEHFRQALEAAWNVDEGVADVTEVAEFVERVVGPRLQERQASIAEVRSLRVRMGELVRPQHPDSDRTPSEERQRPQQRSQPRLTPVPPAGSARPPSGSRPSVPNLRSVDGRGVDGRGADARNADTRSVDARGLEPQVEERRSRPAPSRGERTETSAVISTRAAGRPRRWPLLGSAFLGAGITLGGVALFNVLRSPSTVRLDQGPGVREQSTATETLQVDPRWRPARVGMQTEGQALTTQAPSLADAPNRSAVAAASVPVAAVPAPSVTAAIAAVAENDKAPSKTNPANTRVGARTSRVAATTPRTTPASATEPAKAPTIREPNRKPGLASSPYPGTKSPR